MSDVITMSADDAVRDWACSECGMTFGSWTTENGVSKRSHRFPNPCGNVMLIQVER